MTGIKNKDSKAELVVRSLVHGMGFRYRLHESKLPGKPDIVLPQHKKVILIHGCFWHRHGVCRRLSIPENNPKHWRKRFAQNVERDKRNLRELAKLGWQAMVLWECETKDKYALLARLRAFLFANAPAGP